MNLARRSLLVLTLLLIAAAVAAPAFGSEIIGRDVSRPTLSIDRHGRAHVNYRVRGVRTTLMASQAINARAPSTTRPQVKFKLLYGPKAKGKGVCLPYDGPPLAWLIKACKAPDGSYWALQAWVRLKQNYGGTSGATELHLSHWRGPLASLVIYQNWAERRYRHIFGRLTYNGRGVYGFKSTPRGSPLDSYGRTSTSTPSTPPTGAAGTARTASSRITGATHPATSVTASSRTAAIRPATALSTGRPPSARA